MTSITGILSLADIVRNKRIRWASSVYARHEPDLTPIAKGILRETMPEWSYVGSVAGNVKLE